MKREFYLVSILMALLFTGCHLFKEERTLWKESDDLYDYHVSTRGPALGEGWDLFVTVTGRRSSTVVLRRRIVYNTDVYIPDGFVRAELMHRSVLVVFRHQKKEWGLLVDCADGERALADYVEKGAARPIEK